MLTKTEMGGGIMYIKLRKIWEKLIKNRGILNGKNKIMPALQRKNGSDK